MAKTSGIVSTGEYGPRIDESNTDQWSTGGPDKVIISELTSKQVIQINAYAEATDPDDFFVGGGAIGMGGDSPTDN